MELSYNIKYWIIFAIVFGPLLVEDVNCQAVTRADIDNLQRQVNTCFNNIETCQATADYNYRLIQEIIQREEKRWNDTILSIANLQNQINNMGLRVSSLEGRMNNAEDYIVGLDDRLTEAEARIEKLVKNNELWLHNFKVVKNIFQNGLKFRGRINYQYPTAAVTVVNRPKKVATVASVLERAKKRKEAQEG